MSRNLVEKNEMNYIIDEVLNENSITLDVVALDLFPIGDGRKYPTWEIIFGTGSTTFNCQIQLKPDTNRSSVKTDLLRAILENKA